MAKNKFSHHNDNFSFIAIEKEGFDGITESFNRLKDNILYLNVDNKVKVIQFSSSVSKEAKTLTACNLAASLALNGKKVVLVDCDLRAPRTHRTFKVENEKGIADYMLNNMSIDEVITHTKENVDLLCRGSHIGNASAILASEKYRNLIKELRERYDFVLIDCPPILEISDYIHISTVSDGMIFCVACGRTRRVEVKEALNLIRQSKIKLLGSVYTLVDRKSVHSYGYGYGYGYGYAKYGRYGKNSHSQTQEEEQEENISSEGKTEI